MSPCSRTACLLSALSALTPLVSLADASELIQQPSQPSSPKKALLIRESHSVEQVHPLSEREAALRQKVKDSSIRSLRIDNETLEEAAVALSAVARLQIEVDQSAMEAISDEGLSITLEWPNAVLLTEALDTLCFLGPSSLCWTTKGSKVLITTPKAEARTTCMHLHPVGDITERFAIEDVCTMFMDHLGWQNFEFEGVGVTPDQQMVNVVHTRDTQLDIEAFIDRLRECHKATASDPHFEPTMRESAWMADQNELTTTLVSTGSNEAEIPLSQALLEVSRATEFNFVISPMLREEMKSNGGMDFTVNFEAVQLTEVLDTLATTAGWLKFRRHGRVIRALHEDEICSNRELGIYNVREIVTSGIDAEDGIISPALLEERISLAVARKSWDMNPENSISVTADGLLFVDQEMDALVELRTLLERLQAVARTAQGGKDAR